MPTLMEYINKRDNLKRELLATTEQGATNRQNSINDTALATNKYSADTSFSATKYNADSATTREKMQQDGANFRAAPGMEGQKLSNQFAEETMEDRVRNVTTQADNNKLMYDLNAKYSPGDRQIAQDLGKASVLDVTERAKLASEERFKTKFNANSALSSEADKAEMAADAQRKSANNALKQKAEFNTNPGLGLKEYATAAAFPMLTVPTIINNKIDATAANYDFAEKAAQELGEKPPTAARKALRLLPPIAASDAKGYANKYGAQLKNATAYSDTGHVSAMQQAALNSEESRKRALKEPARR